MLILQSLPALIQDLKLHYTSISIHRLTKYDVVFKSNFINVFNVFDPFYSLGFNVFSSRFNDFVPYNVDFSLRATETNAAAQLCKLTF